MPSPPPPHSHPAAQVIYQSQFKLPSPASPTPIQSHSTTPGIARHYTPSTSTYTPGSHFTPENSNRQDQAYDPYSTAPRVVIEDQSAPKRTRTRPTKSCERCRSKKLKCDREFPCGHCRKFGRDSAKCVYRDGLDVGGACERCRSKKLSVIASHRA